MAWTKALQDVNWRYMHYSQRQLLLTLHVLVTVLLCVFKFLKCVNYFCFTKLRQAWSNQHTYNCTGIQVFNILNKEGRSSRRRKSKFLKHVRSPLLPCLFFSSVEEWFFLWNGFVRGRMVLFVECFRPWKNGFVRGRMVSFVEEWFCPWKNGFVRGRMVLFVEDWFYSWNGFVRGRMVLFEKPFCYLNSLNGKSN